MARLAFGPGTWLQSPLSLASCCLSSSVPGGIAAESLTFTPLEDMIFLKWEEPQEPNGLITQYEVGLGPITVGTPGGRWAESLEREAHGGWTEGITEVPSALLSICPVGYGDGVLKAGERSRDAQRPGLVGIHSSIEPIPFAQPIPCSPEP